MGYDGLKEVMKDYQLGNIGRMEMVAAFALYQLKTYGHVMEVKR